MEKNRRTLIWSGALVLGLGLLGGDAPVGLAAPAGEGAVAITAPLTAANDIADDAGEMPVPAGTIDDGEEFLADAGISLEEAIAAAQGAASGAIGEVDLERFAGTLVFNVDVGDQDVKVDAATGEILSVDSDD